MKMAFLAVAAVLLVAAPAAQSKSSKEMRLLQVCGASGCEAIKPAVSLRDGALSAVTAPPFQRYYVLKVGWGDGRKIFVRGEQYFVPAAGATLSKDTPGPVEGWGKLPARAATVAGAVAARLKPFPAPVPSAAYIGTRRIADVTPFLALLGPLEQTTVPQTGESPVAIGLEFRRANPWSTSAALLNYLPKAHVVIRLDGYFRVPDRVADRIDRLRR
jgi:hypothetical protein